MLAVTTAALSLLAQGPSLPELPRLPPIRRDPQLTYVDRTGAVLGVRGGKIPPPVDLARLPAHVPAAFIAIEDRRFWGHTGFDPAGLARAVITSVDKGGRISATSTITQQTARMLWLNQDRTLERKTRELIYAVQLEQTYSKRDILGLYLSRAYYGAGATGLEAAAQRYFNKPAARLSIREAAMLAALMKSPTNYNPAENPEASAGRTKLVLDAMREIGAITPAQYQTALKAKPRVWRTAPNAPAQYFLDWVDDQARAVVGTPRQDIVVETTLDMAMETAAAEAAVGAVNRAKGLRAEQAAVVAVDGAGRVRTMVGGTDYVRAPYNRAASARRQAGSAFKPFVYLTALEAGRTPDTPVMDEPVTINGWTPVNYTPGNVGALTLEQALAQSVNTVAARLADEVGRESVAATVHRLGVTSAVNTDPAMALGTSLISPLELTQAYAVFANGGNKVAAYGVERIRTPAGRVLYQRKAPVWTPVLANPALSDLNRMMRTVITNGTGGRAAVPGQDLAGKTGTTSDYRDAWFCGHTGGLAACAWMGRDDNAPMGPITGGGAPAEIWRGLMTTAVRRIAVQAIPTGPPPPEPPPPPLPPVEEPQAVEQQASASGILPTAPP